MQTYLQFGADLTAIVLLIHASGGISSSLGGILVVSVGTLALVLESERAFMLAAVTTLVLLLEQTLAQLQGMTTTAQFAPVGILGAAIFVITAVVQLLRTRIVETEALAEQRGLDLRNVVELNEYIIQHLRESIVVVDGENRIRLINGSAAKHLGGGHAAHRRNAARGVLGRSPNSSRPGAHSSPASASQAFSSPRRLDDILPALRAAR